MSKSKNFLDMREAGPRLRELREQRSMSPSRLADLLHLSPSHLYKIERGTANPTLFALIKAARYFDVPLSYLAGENVEGVAS